MRFKRKSNAPILIFIFAFGALCFCSCVKKKIDLSEQIAIKVEDNSLTAKEYSERLLQILKNRNALSAKDTRVIEESKLEVSRQFILESLIQIWAKKHNIFVRTEQLDQEISEIQTSYPDEFSFKEALVKESIDLKTWKSKLRFSILQRLVLNQIKSEIVTPTEAEIKAIYNQHKTEYKVPEQIQLTQIVLSSESDAKALQKKLKDRVDFSHLAKKFSITPEGSTGGNLGWVDKGLSETFDKAFSIPVGSTSRIIKSPYGYHIFKVKGKRRAQSMSYEDAAKRIRKELLNNREKAKIAAWFEEQIRTVKVFKDEDLIKGLNVVTAN